LYDYATTFFVQRGNIMTLHEREQGTILQTYRRLPIDVTHGNGMYVYDHDGTPYLDFLGGVAVNALGYGHRRLEQAIAEQLAAYIHVSNYFVQQPQVVLAEKLRAVTGYERVFFCNSGTEANEAALKLARKWGAAKNKTEIVSMENAFHGRTMGALSMMSSHDYRHGFAPFLDRCISISLNDADALRHVVGTQTAAIFVEPIQGEGGIYELQIEFVHLLHELRERFGLLLVADEVQSGIGRTGKFLAGDHYGLKPDMVTLAKPLGGGLPLGAMLVTKELEQVLQPGNHGTTFGGNPVACAAGRVVLEEIVERGLMRNAAEVGGYFSNQLTALKAKLPDAITEVRGKGLMLGIELPFPGKSVADAMLARKIIINCTHQNVLRFLPPLIVERKHVDTLCSALSESLEQTMKKELPLAIE
jgi:predicted acetylornithine/succinylornithine family transaminase